MEETTLSLLGKKTEYPQDYAPEVLEAFNNKHPEMDYWVRFNCPEFTSLCPITGQPDFATIQIDYIPDIKMVESKSLKLYLRLRQLDYERSHQTYESQIHRSYRFFYTERRDQHIPILQLRTSRY